MKIYSYKIKINNDYQKELVEAAIARTKVSITYDGKYIK